MDDEKQAQQVWARLPAAIARLFAIRCAELGIKRPEGVQQAIERWLGSFMEIAGEAHPNTTTAERAQWHAFLDYILDYGTESNRNGIQQNLDWGISKVRSEGAPALIAKAHRKASESDPLEFVCPVCESDLRLADPESLEIVKPPGMGIKDTDPDPKMETLLRDFMVFMRSKEGLSQDKALRAILPGILAAFREQYRSHSPTKKRQMR
jgi:hypothetical protein